MRYKRLCAALLAVVLGGCAPVAPARGGSFSIYPTLQSYADHGRCYQYIALGSYPQGADGSAGPILWRVLGTTQGKALLLSEYILAAAPLHPDSPAYAAMDGAWRETGLFTWLNDSFFHSAFAPAEQALLCADEKQGRVFVLTAADLRNRAYGLGSDQARLGVGTPYALAQGLFQYRTSPGGRGSSPYWTRTSAWELPEGAYCTKMDGRIGYARSGLHNTGVRPALWLTLDQGRIQAIAGDGSLAQPWVLAQ